MIWADAVLHASCLAFMRAPCSIRAQIRAVSVTVPIMFMSSSTIFIM